MIATYIKVDGTEEVVEPADDKEFTLRELQAFVGGYVQMVEFPDGTEIWVHEEGKLLNFPINRKATALWAEAFKGYEFGADDIIVGNVLTIKK